MKLHLMYFIKRNAGARSSAKRLNYLCRDSASVEWDVCAVVQKLRGNRVRRMCKDISCHQRIAEDIKHVRR